MEQTRNKTFTAATKTIQEPNNFEDEHRGEEGPMGRPAFFRGVTPKDLDTEAKNVPPIKGTPPRRRIGKILVGAHKRGLKPHVFRETRANILPRKSGLFGV